MKSQYLLCLLFFSDLTISDDDLEYLPPGKVKIPDYEKDAPTGSKLSKTAKKDTRKDTVAERVNNSKKAASSDVVKKSKGANDKGKKVVADDDDKPRAKEGGIIDYGKYYLISLI